MLGLNRRSGKPVTPGVILACLTVFGLGVGCASFSDQAPKDWSAQPQLNAEQGPQPNLLGGGVAGGQPGQGGTSSSLPPPQGCTDYDPAVIATCLDQVSAVTALPDGGAVLAAERVSGKILQVKKGVAPVQVASFSVDSSGDGGLTGLALSPTYAEDQLAFAYVTTSSDNRIIRFTNGDAPKPILTGIPKGPNNNRGVLAVDKSGAILVATGNAGNPVAAADPNSLAGKVLRIDASGKSTVIASGVHNPGGLCVTSDNKTTWLTDRADTSDQLYQVSTGKPLGSPAWTWPDKPGLAGCAAASNVIVVATAHKAGVQSLALNKNGSFNGKPTVSMDGPKGYGQISGMELINDQALLIGTVNKAGGSPISSDDRVAIIKTPPPGTAKD